MRRVAIISTLALLVLSFNSIATVWTVDPTRTESNYLPTLQAANDNPAVAGGDTIYLPGSQNNYGNLILGKQLSIFGPGYYLSNIAGNFGNRLPANVYQIKLDAGSEGSVLAGISNSYVYVKVSNVQIFRNNNITVSVRNEIPNYLVNNIYFYQNFSLVIERIGDNSYNGSYSAQDGTYLGNIYFLNNYISNISGQYNAAIPVSNLVFNNNYIERLSDPSFQYATFNNNYFPGTWVFNQCKLKNNATGTSSLLKTGSTGNTEVGTLKSRPLSYCYLNQTANSDIWLSAVKTGSTLKNAGSDGTDIGPTGGDFPYIPSGQPPIPVIYSLDVPATTSGNTLQIKIGTRVTR